jgi:hypothetical protein
VQLPFIKYFLPQLLHLSPFAQSGILHLKSSILVLRLKSLSLEVLVPFVFTPIINHFPSHLASLSILKASWYLLCADLLSC